MKQKFELFLVSFAALFLEMAVIRWLSAESMIFSYFKNIPLIVAVFGMGLGCALAGTIRDRSRYLFFSLLLLVLTVSTVFYQHLPRFSFKDLAIWEFNTDIQPKLVLLFFFRFLTIVALVLLPFVGVGQLLGAAMKADSPLRSYAVNLLGSLAGILAFVAVSWLRWPPSAWFLVGGAPFLWFFRANRQALAFHLLLLANLAVLAHFPNKLWDWKENRIYWSPYSRIEFTPLYEDVEVNRGEKLGYFLGVNKAYYQRILDLTPEKAARFPKQLGPSLAYYDLPYRFKPAPGRVLVVGAGTGNDVAAALRNGAGAVDAVEIDPVILDLGRQYHPARPYQDPRVQAYAEDTRQFFYRSAGGYDAIVFGLLDSHVLFSTFSNLRQDEFVYTRESLAAAARLLAPGGMIALTFCLGKGQSFLFTKFSRLVKTVFPEREAVMVSVGHDGGIMFLIGEGITAGRVKPCLGMQQELLAMETPSKFEIEVPSDDWPFLYLRKRMIPTEYLVGMGILFLIFCCLVLPVFRGAGGFPWHFFFLGGAFMLVEVLNVTRMALLFGSTWLVNSFVVAAILVMILASNGLAIRLRGRGTVLAFVLLGASLLVNFFFPVSSLLSLPIATRYLAAGVLMGMPLFFAGLIFSSSFAKTPDVAAALGANLLGSVAGGFLEYGSLVVGFRWLVAFAAVLYLAAWFKRPR